jgi:hypothetical protein
MLIAFQNRVLATSLDVEIDVDRNAGAARPARLRKLGSVAAKIPRRPEISLGSPTLGLRGWFGASSDRTWFGRQGLAPFKRVMSALAATKYRPRDVSGQHSILSDPRIHYRQIA